MSIILMSKVKKRVNFELVKLCKKYKYYIFQEWNFDVLHGKYPVKNSILNSVLFSGSINTEEECFSHGISDANYILDGRLNLIYFKLDKLDNESTGYWNTDHESGYEYPKKYHGDLKYIISDEKTDVKNVWELSRLQHLVIVAKSYAMTKDDKYYFFVKRNIISWLSANPNGSSVNWTCNMEVAIRVVNLIVCYEMLLEGLKKDDGFKSTLKAMIFYHNKHIENHLENYSNMRNNHYLSNLMGLLISSKFLECKNLDKYQKLQKFAIVELQNEIDKQIYADGLTYEVTTSYQKLVYEILLLSVILGQSKKYKFECQYIERIYGMYVFLRSIKNAEGEIPLIGDNDSGNILVFDDYFNINRSNFSSLMNISECYFGFSDTVNSSLALYLGRKAPKKFELPDIKTSYPDSGYYIVRNSHFSLLIRCGPLSMKGQGGHSHNDQLSFVLDVEGVPVFIDPGTITYTGSAEWRNYSRKTSSHNTVQIGDAEQNIIGDDLFSLKERTFSECLKHSIHQFDGVHYGYSRDFGCVHKRSIRVNENELSIVDRLLGIDNEKNILGKVNLILSSAIEIVDDNGFIKININRYKSITTNLKVAECLINDIFISKRYGHYQKSKKLTCEFEIISKIRMTVQ